MQWKAKVITYNTGQNDLIYDICIIEIYNQEFYDTSEIIPVCLVFNKIIAINYFE